MAVPQGPHPISKKGQVTVPVAVLRALRLKAGEDSIWFEVQGDRALLLPAEVVDNRWELGRRAEQEAADATE